jgi:DNA-binding IclR family transcriptional regulator
VRRILFSPKALSVAHVLYDPDQPRREWSDQQIADDLGLQAATVFRAFEELQERRVLTYTRLSRRTGTRVVTLDLDNAFWALIAQAQTSDPAWVREVAK